MIKIGTKISINEFMKNEKEFLEIKNSLVTVSYFVKDSEETTLYNNKPLTIETSYSRANEYNTDFNHKYTFVGFETASFERFNSQTKKKQLWARYTVYLK